MRHECYYNFCESSKAWQEKKIKMTMTLSSSSDNYLVKDQPALGTYTLVDNHDFSAACNHSNRLWSHWFKPLAYALILLRQDGYPLHFLRRLFYGRAHYKKGQLRRRIRILAR